VTAGSTIQPCGWRFGDPRSKGFALSRTKWDSKNSILLEKFIENDVVISEVDARAHAILSKEKSKCLTGMNWYH
jgi:hypothetical protein